MLDVVYLFQLKLIFPTMSYMLVNLSYGQPNISNFELSDNIITLIITITDLGLPTICSLFSAVGWCQFRLQSGTQCQSVSYSLCMFVCQSVTVYVCQSVSQSSLCTVCQSVSQLQFMNVNQSVSYSLRMSVKLVSELIILCMSVSELQSTVCMSASQ